MWISDQRKKLSKNTKCPGVAGLSQEVVSTCYARHVSRKPRALDEVSQGGLASRLMAGLGN